MKRVLHLLEFCAAALMLCVTVTLCSWITRPTNTDHDVAAIKAFHGLPKNSIDVIGYGSSHMWRGFDPAVLNDKYGLSAFNYGGNWQHINTTRLFVEDSLLTQTPKVILVETYLVNKLLEDVDMDGEIYYTRYLPDSEAKEQYLKQCFHNSYERYLAYYFPLTVFHENWKQLEENSARSMNDLVKQYEESRGYNSRTRVTPFDSIESESDKDNPLSEEAIKELDQIIDICRQRNIDIIFYTAPYVGHYQYGNAMAQYAAAHQCYYINMFDIKEEMGIDYSTDFFDEGHLNDNGAKKVADYLGNFIISIL